MKRRILTLVALLASTFALSSGLQGCAAFYCDNYRTYDDTLDTWMGADLSDYERRTDNRAYSTMDRPRNRIEYAFNTPYYNYDGTQEACRTWLEVDRGSGEIVGWRYEGACYMHGRCAD